MALALLPASKTLAQTNAQILYDFGNDRKYVTLTLEMFKQDKWGSTYFFVDHDFNYDKMDPNQSKRSTGRHLYRDFTCLELLAEQQYEKLEPARGVQWRYHQELPYQQCLALRCGVSDSRC